MENSKQPINPCLMQQVGEDYFRLNKSLDPEDYTIPCSGLTKREYFAGLAMQGLLTTKGVEIDKSYASKEPVDVIKKAIQYADELLKQLDK